MNKFFLSRKDSPKGRDIRWDFSCAGRAVPALRRGQVVLVEYFHGDRIAIVQGRIPGGVYWAQLCSPVGGATRVVVTKHSLKAVEVDAK